MPARHWRLLHNLGKPRLFVDHIIVDPRNPKVLYVGAHRHDQPGGFFKSTDGGQTWSESAQLKNEVYPFACPIRSRPRRLDCRHFHTASFALTTRRDSWKQLPTQQVEGLHHVESLAIDPRTASTIYAGTWYLPYKSLDGGQTWKIIREGMIDDSDVFAIDIDPRDPNHIFASACSGIYESKNGGDMWRKCREYRRSRDARARFFSIRQFRA